MDDLKAKLTELMLDVKEIKGMGVEVLKEQAVHNVLLKEHERRSLALEAQQAILKATTDERIKPLEKQSDWMNRIMQFFGAILIAVAVKYIVTKINGG